MYRERERQLQRIVKESKEQLKEAEEMQNDVDGNKKKPKNNVQRDNQGISSRMNEIQNKIWNEIEVRE